MVARCVALLALALLAACASTPPAREAASPHYKVGSPYRVDGKTYYPKEDDDYVAVGVASWYGDEFQGRPTANGEIFDKNRLSAAHTTLPLPSLVEVENLENGRRVVVRVNDRGPFVGDRLIDLSHAAARALDYDKKGLARVRVRYLGKARLADLAPVYGGAVPVKLAAAETRTPASPKPKAPKPAPTTASSSSDSMAQFIDAALKAPPPSADAELWINVADYADLNELEKSRIRLSSLNAFRIVTTPADGGAFRYALQAGPYPDASSMEASLAALREAGYSNAMAAAAGACDAASSTSETATC